MKKAFIIFPNQLFENQYNNNKEFDFYLIEEYMFFKHYKFHKQKLVFHRASMQAFADNWTDRNLNYIACTNTLSDIRLLIPDLIEKGYGEITCFDPVDNWLEKRIRKFDTETQINFLPSPLFLNNVEELQLFFGTKKRMFQTAFYINERKKRNILLEPNNEPVGGQWSFDADNRKKYPAKKLPPSIQFPDKNKFIVEAENYVETHFAHNYGNISGPFTYPIDSESSKIWFEEFLEQRLDEFGEYEDAIVSKAYLLNHSLLSPLINIGLLTPDYVLNRIVEFSEINKTRINSTEGLIRQIMGWREFIRAVYELKGTQERTTNFWKFKRKIPHSFYDGTTGIEPIDITIKKVLETGYCHHIERLMVLSNFMLLCEFDPDEVHKWFMELFIDAYDWVMVPNVYGMSQFADGGLMSTKPYISGSNYLFKMSDYSKGPWADIWDALFWRFMDSQRTFFLSNPRLGMLVRTFDKFNDDKKLQIYKTAEEYLEKLK